MSTKLLGILALFSTLLFVSVVVLQVLELLHYGNPPSVWLATP